MEKRAKGIKRSAELPPRDKSELWRWVKDHVWLRVPEGAPLDYLAHAFFEGEEGWPEAEAGKRKSGKKARGKRKGVCKRKSGMEEHRSPRADFDGTEDDTGARRIVCEGSLEGHALEGHGTDCVVWACRGGGKTLLAALATALDLKFKEGIEVRLLAGSVEQGTRMYEHLKRILAMEAFSEGVGKINAREVVMKNGSRAALLSHSEPSVRGTRVQKVRCDEVELFTRDVWDAAQLTTVSRRCGSVLVKGSIEALSTMHRPFGLMSELVEDGKAGRRKLFHWGLPSVLAPCEHWHLRLPVGECPILEECGRRPKPSGDPEEDRTIGFMSVRDAAAMKGRVSEDTWRAEMLCEKVSRGDCVLPEFDPGVHVFDRLPPGDSVFVAGMDFGFRAPTVIVWATVDSEGGIWVVDEYVKTETVLAEHIGVLKRSLWPARWIGADPAGLQHNGHTGESEVQALRRAGFEVRHRAMHVLPGLMRIRARLRAADESGPRLRVHKRCQQLIEAMSTYHYNVADPTETDPVKDGPDHAVDALRYLVVNLERPEEAVKRYA